MLGHASSVFTDFYVFLVTTDSVLFIQYSMLYMNIQLLIIIPIHETMHIILPHLAY